MQLLPPPRGPSAAPQECTAPPTPQAHSPAPTCMLICTQLVSVMSIACCTMHVLLRHKQQSEAADPRLDLHVHLQGPATAPFGKQRPTPNRPNNCTVAALPNECPNILATKRLLRPATPPNLTPHACKHACEHVCACKYICAACMQAHLPRLSRCAMQAPASKRATSAPCAQLPAANMRAERPKASWSSTVAPASSSTCKNTHPKSSGSEVGCSNLARHTLEKILSENYH